MHSLSFAQSTCYEVFSLGDCGDLVIIMIADISVSTLMGDLLSFGVVFFLQGKGGDEMRSNINIAKVVFIAGWDQWKVPDLQRNCAREPLHL